MLLILLESAQRIGFYGGDFIILSLMCKEKLNSEYSLSLGFH